MQKLQHFKLDLKLYEGTFGPLGHIGVKPSNQPSAVLLVNFSMMGPFDIISSKAWTLHL